MIKLVKKLLPAPGSVLSGALGGASLFFLLFIYGFVQNMSMSYMGNTSKQAEDYIIINFLGHIVIFLLKILATYLIIGFALGLAALLLTRFVLNLFNRKIDTKKNFFINFVLSAFIFAAFFFKDLIVYPQVYINNFYARNRINRSILDFLSDSINPFLFTIVQIAVAVLILISILFYFYRTHKSIFKKSICIALPLIVIIVLFFIFAGKKPAKFSKPNILILASDALRPDHFSGYGYFRNTTPNIDRLINEGVSFRNTFVEVPRTFPSWISILTGRFASTHGVRHMFPASRDVNSDFRTIAKILNNSGYETSVITDFAGDIFTRAGLGYNKVDAPYFNVNIMIEQIILDAHSGLFPFIMGKIGLNIFPALKDSAYFCPPALVKDRIINAVKKTKKPFFITSFFSSTHFPYSAPYPYYRMYAEKNYKGPYKYFKQRIITLDNNGEAATTGKDIAQTNALYDGGLKAFDDSVGEVLNFLSDNNILDNTMIILLSDHGENLYEDNLGMGHGEHFRGQYAVKIPLIIRCPSLGLKKKEIKNIVRHIDIAPTILAMLQIPVPEYMEGVSLLPLIKENWDRIKNLNAFGETGIWFDNSTREDLFFQKLRIMYPDITALSEVEDNFDNQIILKDEYRDIINLAKHRYIFDGRYKLIYMPLRDKAVYELYDTYKDPEEKNNIVLTDFHNYDRLKKILFQWIGRNGDVIIKKDFVFPFLRY